jgi:hypothetical protein
MENTTKEENTTVVREVAKVPAEVGGAIVDGAETVGRATEKVVVEAATVVVDATKAVAGDIAKAGEQLVQDTKPVRPRAPEPLTPSLADPIVVDPVATVV